MAQAAAKKREEANESYWHAIKNFIFGNYEGGVYAKAAEAKQANPGEEEARKQVIESESDKTYRNGLGELQYVRKLAESGHAPQAKKDFNEIVKRYEMCGMTPEDRKYFRDEASSVSKKIESRLKYRARA